MGAQITRAESALISENLTTTSLAVAERFGKQHKDVLKRIDALQIPADYHERNFAPKVKTVNIGSGATRQTKFYELTRDGFALLVMGFTGARAMEWKIKFLDAFNAMEARLRENAPRVTQVRAHTRRVSAPPMEQVVSALNNAPLPSSAPRDLLRAELQRHARAIVALMSDSAPEGLERINSAFITVRGDKVEVGGCAFPKSDGWRHGDQSATLMPNGRWEVQGTPRPRALIGGAA